VSFDGAVDRRAVLEWLDDDDDGGPRDEWDWETRLFAFAEACARGQEAKAVALAGALLENGIGGRRAQNNTAKLLLECAVVNDRPARRSVVLPFPPVEEGKASFALVCFEFAVVSFATTTTTTTMYDCHASFVCSFVRSFGHVRFCSNQRRITQDVIGSIKDEADEGLVVLAAKLNKVRALKALLPRNERTETGLFEAARFGSLEALECLLENGAEVNIAKMNGSTPLLTACLKGHADCARTLVKYGAAVDRERTDTGATPLWVSSEMGHAACVRLLVEAGADVGKGTKENGATALLVACQNGHAECAKVLIEAARQSVEATFITPGVPRGPSGDLEPEERDAKSHKWKRTVSSDVEASLTRRDEEGDVVNKGRLDNGATPLYMACQNGHLACAKLLVESGAEIDNCTTDGHFVVALNVDCADVDKGRTDNGGTPLGAACRSGHVDCVELMLSVGASVDKARTDDKRTPLFEACWNGHADCAQALLDAGADVNLARAADGRTPLFEACANGNEDCVQALLAAGAVVDQRLAGSGATPLLVACQDGAVDTADLLCQAGADVDLPRLDDGATPIYMCCQNGHYDCAKLLVANGADVSKPRTDVGVTPLWAACQQGHLDCARLVLAAPGGRNYVDKARRTDGVTPLFWAASVGFDDCLRLLCDHGIISCIRLASPPIPGADVSKAKSTGETPLWIACFHGHDDCARLLVPASSFLPSFFCSPDFLLFSSSLRLVERGADVDAARNDGATPVFVAAQGGHAACVRILIDGGADASKGRKAGLFRSRKMTPLKAAKNRHHAECVRLLQSNHA